MKSIARLLLATGATIALPSIASAQDDNEEQAGEIIVTAQRKSERLVDVPIAVTALDEASLEKRQIGAASDLVKIVPNLSYTATNFGGTNFSIRGIGRSVIGDGADSGVAFHYNGAFLQNGGNTNLFYDVEGVEILRGPQGTLFGRNATGGVINIRSRKPDFDLGGYAEAGIGTRGTYFGGAAVNVPVSDTLAVRLSGLGLKSGGDIRDLTSSKRLNGEGIISARGSLRWQPSNQTTVDLTVNFLRANSRSLQAERRACTRDPIGNLGCLPDSLGSDFPNSLATLSGLIALQIGLISDAYDPYENAVNPWRNGQVALDFLPQAFAREWVTTLEIEQEVGAIKLSSLTAYANDTGFYTSDPDFAVANSFLPVPGLFPGGNVPTSAPDPDNLGVLNNVILGTFNRPYQFEKGVGKGEQWLQEVRLASNFGGQFEFLLGGFFLDYDRSEDFFSISNSLDAIALITGTPTPFLRIETQAADLRSYSGFGEIYVKPSDEITLTGGLRWTRDEKTQVNRSTLLGGIPPFTDNFASTEKVTGRFVADWKPDIGNNRDLKFYASYARGYKGGGFNPQGQVAVPLTFKPEIIDSIEGGAKFASRQFSANLAAFHYKYNDLQVSKIVNQTSVNENIDAKVWGIELETLATFGGLSVDGSLAYLKSEIGNTLSIDPRDPTGGDPNLIAVKDINTGANCVATLAQLFNPALLDGIPFGDCAALGLPDGVPVSLKGNQLANSPKWSARLGIEYATSLGKGWGGSLRVDWNWRGNFWGRIFNRAPVDQISGYSLVDARIEIAREDEKLFGRIEVRNLFNKRGVTGLYLGDASSGLPTNLFLIPSRSISATIGTKF